MRFLTHDLVPRTHAFCDNRFRLNEGRQNCLKGSASNENISEPQCPAEKSNAFFEGGHSADKTGCITSRAALEIDELRGFSDNT